MNTIFNNNNGRYSYTGFVEKLRIEHFIMVSGIEQEMGVDTQKEHSEKIVENGCYWGFNETFNHACSKSIIKIMGHRANISTREANNLQFVDI